MGYINCVLYIGYQHDESDLLFFPDHRSTWYVVYIIPMINPWAHICSTQSTSLKNKQTQKKNKKQKQTNKNKSKDTKKDIYMLKPSLFIPSAIS